MGRIVATRSLGVFLLGALLFSFSVGGWCKGLGGFGTVPEEAAQAALSAIHLKTFEDVRLESVRQDSIQVYCGHELQLGVKLDERQYDLSTGKEVEWKKLDGRMLVGKANEGDEPSCVLPDISLVGPIEIELTNPSRTSFHFSPEPMSLPSISKLILREGTSVRLSDVKSLKLRSPVTLPQLPEGYVDSIFGKPSRQKSSEQQNVVDDNGLLRLGTDLHRMALDRPKDSPLLVFDLEASEQGLMVRATDRGNVGVMEMSPGVVEIVETQGSPTSSVDELWAWPFINLKGSTLSNYEALFKSFLSAHWPPLKSPIQVTSASTEVLSLLHFEMDVRRESLAQHSTLPDFESEKGPLEVWEAHVIVRQTDSENVFVPVQMDMAELHDNTITFSSVSKAMLTENVTVVVDDQLSDVYF
ncbi:hypothetical protein BSKO_10172 [Bryopsis sp. KO-2023]|nr:hypothetical protein BSKO_10172 [Bryopsis sp. KO-2023]